MPQKKRTTKSSSRERRSSAKVKLSPVEKALINGVHYVPLPVEKRAPRR